MIGQRRVIDLWRPSLTDKCYKLHKVKSLPSARCGLEMTTTPETTFEFSDVVWIKKMATRYHTSRKATRSHVAVKTNILRIFNDCLNRTQLPTYNLKGHVYGRILG